MVELEDPSSKARYSSNLENDTYQHDSTLTVCIAINYGSHRDKMNVIISLAKTIASGELAADDVTTRMTFHLFSAPTAVFPILI
jgi:undecaprenyl pyrophosphate synthase